MGPSQRGRSWPLTIPQQEASCERIENRLLPGKRTQKVERALQAIFSRAKTLIRAQLPPLQAVSTQYELPLPVYRTGFPFISYSCSRSKEPGTSHDTQPSEGGLSSGA